MIELANAVVLLLLGGMLFFPIVVAPIVFKSLPEVEAGQFLRSMFPRYYVFIITLSALAFALYQGGVGLVLSVPATVCLAVALSTLWVRQSLVPRINDARDAQLAGGMLPRVLDLIVATSCLCLLIWCSWLVCWLFCSLETGSFRGRTSRQRSDSLLSYRQSPSFPRFSCFRGYACIAWFISVVPHGHARGLLAY